MSDLLREDGKPRSLPVRKCDKCKAEIPVGAPLTPIPFGGGLSWLCDDCSKPYRPGPYRNPGHQDPAA